MQIASSNSMQSRVMLLHRIPPEHINMTDELCGRSVSSKRQCRNWRVCLYFYRQSWARRTRAAPLPSGKPPSEPKVSPSSQCYRHIRQVPTNPCILHTCNFGEVVSVQGHCCLRVLTCMLKGKGVSEKRKGNGMKLNHIL